MILSDKYEPWSLKYRIKHGFIQGTGFRFMVSYILHVLEDFTN